MSIMLMLYNIMDHNNCYCNSFIIFVTLLLALAMHVSC